MSAIYLVPIFATDEYTAVDTKLDFFASDIVTNEEYTLPMQLSWTATEPEFVVTEDAFVTICFASDPTQRGSARLTIILASHL